MPIWEGVSDVRGGGSRRVVRETAWTGREVGGRSELMPRPKQIQWMDENIPKSPEAESRCCCNFDFDIRFLSLAATTIAAVCLAVVSV